MLLETDVAVIGGGLVGISVGYGLSLQNVESVVLDEGDGAIRASRGNFGLVWVQGKGLAFAPYTDWALRAVEQWPELSQRLLSENRHRCRPRAGRWALFLPDAGGAGKAC